MIKMALKNSKEYELDNRVRYVNSDAAKIPFEDIVFDGVFTNGSLHEWKTNNNFPGNPSCSQTWWKIFYKRHAQRYELFAKWFLKINTKPSEIRPGLISSIKASYTVE